MEYIYRYICIICFCLLPFYMYAQTEHDNRISMKNDVEFEAPVCDKTSIAETYYYSKPDKVYLSNTTALTLQPSGIINMYAPFSPYFYYQKIGLKVSLYKEYRVNLTLPIGYRQI